MQTQVLVTGPSVDYIPVDLDHGDLDLAKSNVSLSGMRTQLSMTTFICTACNNKVNILVKRRFDREKSQVTDTIYSVAVTMYSIYLIRFSGAIFITTCNIVY